MTTTDYVIDALLILIVLRQVRWSRLDLSMLLLPLAGVAAAAAYYIRDVPTAGHDVQLYVVLGVIGAVLGAGCALAMQTRAGRDGGVEVRSGTVSAALWVIGMGGRMAFAIAANHWAAHDVADFSRDNAITSSSAWVTGMLIMALAQVVTRQAGMFLKVQHAGRTRRAAVAA